MSNIQKYQGTPVSPVGSVGAFACGKDVHGTSAPSEPSANF